MSIDVASRRFAARVVEILRAERLRKGISMRGLAQRSGLSQPAISYMERGLRTPSLETAYRIAVALEIDLSKLIKWALAGDKTRSDPRTSHLRHSQNI
jgi:transcriptional regulator with XRE-family HTH domain